MPGTDDALKRRGPTVSYAAYSWMIFAASLFAAMNFLAHVSGAHAHWSAVAAVRSLVGALVAIGIARVRGAQWWVPPTRAMWLRSLFGSAALACSFYALASGKLLLADAITLNNTTPIFVALLSPFVIGEKVSAKLFPLLGISILGVTLIVQPPAVVALLHGTGRAVAQAAVGGSEQGAAAIALLGAVFSSLAMLSLRKAGANESPEAIAAHFSLTAFVLLAITSFILAPLPPLSTWLPMVAVGLFAGAAQVAMTKAYSLEKAARVGVFAYFQVVIGAALGCVLMGEPLSAWSIGGMIAIVASGAILAFVNEKAEKARQPA